MTINKVTLFIAGLSATTGVLAKSPPAPLLHQNHSESHRWNHPKSIPLAPENLKTCSQPLTPHHRPRIYISYTSAAIDDPTKTNEKTLSNLQESTRHQRHPSIHGTLVTGKYEHQVKDEKLMERPQRQEHYKPRPHHHKSYPQRSPAERLPYQPRHESKLTYLPSMHSVATNEHVRPKQEMPIEMELENEPQDKLPYWLQSEESPDNGLVQEPEMPLHTAEPFPQVPVTESPVKQLPTFGETQQADQSDVEQQQADQEETASPQFSGNVPLPEPIREAQPNKWVISEQWLTSEPITSEPITSVPITSEPITSVPITSEPITLEPITSESITSEPITSEPITSEPITSEPITSDFLDLMPLSEDAEDSEFDDDAIIIKGVIMTARPLVVIVKGNCENTPSLRGYRKDDKDDSSEEDSDAKDSEKDGEKDFGEDSIHGRHGSMMFPMRYSRSTLPGSRMSYTTIGGINWPRSSMSYVSPTTYSNKWYSNMYGGLRPMTLLNSTAQESSEEKSGESKKVNYGAMSSQWRMTPWGFQPNFQQLAKEDCKDEECKENIRNGLKNPLGLWNDPSGYLSESGQKTLMANKQNGLFPLSNGAYVMRPGALTPVWIPMKKVCEDCKNAVQSTSEDDGKSDEDSSEDSSDS